MHCRSPAGIGLVALTVVPHSSAHAQSADLVLCDRIAADPADPDKPADVKGVAEIAPSDIATAIKFCKTASGASRRAMYQLGRAYAASRPECRMPIAAFRKAADKGSTSAMAELGARLASGSGVAKDEAQARKLLERSAEAGNPRAIAALGGFVRRRHAVRSGESARAADERRRQQSGSAVSARADAGERRRRAAGRCRRARVV